MLNLTYNYKLRHNTSRIMTDATQTPSILQRTSPQKNYVPRHTNYTNQTNNSSDPSLYSMHSCQTNMSDYSGNTNIIHQRYNIMQRIGEGSFGRVYLAYDMSNRLKSKDQFHYKEIQDKQYFF